MWKAILCCMAVLVWICMPHFSQAESIHPGRWWHMPQVSEDLHITDAQIQKLDELFLDNRRKLIDLKSEVEKERLELGNILEREPLDEAAVTAQFKDLQAARTNLSAERLRFILEVRRILTPEQFRQLGATYRQFREKRYKDRWRD